MRRGRVAKAQRQDRADQRAEAYAQLTIQEKYDRAVERGHELTKEARKLAKQL